MRSLPRSRIIVAVISLISIAFGLTYNYITQSARFAQPAFPLGVVPDHVCDDSDKSIAGQDVAQKQVIPNFVHYVWILKDRRDFRLSFKTFISIYSAHVFWHPERIYIHTDAAPEIIDKAKAKASGPPWTKRVLAIPGVTLNHVEATKSTVKGVEINHLEHKADFLRIAALRDFGGVYLDTDAVPLRDIADLRNSGFANILGGAVALSMKHSGYINNGVMMSVPHSTLMSIYYHAAQEFFNGEWATASIHVLTNLANRLLPLPSEVLILHPRAFAPTSWEFEDQKRLFAPTLGVATGTREEAAAGLPEQTCRSALAWLRQHQEGDDATDVWKLDFSSTYVLHAFDNLADGIRGWDHRVDVKYVLDRRSNYARAVFPAVWHAVQAGIIPEGEI